MNLKSVKNIKVRVPHTISKHHFKIHCFRGFPLSDQASLFQGIFPFIMEFTVSG
jgi:hypothetical protein